MHERVGPACSSDGAREGRNGLLDSGLGLYSATANAVGFSA